MSIIGVGRGAALPVNTTRPVGLTGRIPDQDPRNKTAITPVGDVTSSPFAAALADNQASGGKPSVAYQRSHATLPGAQPLSSSGRGQLLNLIV